VEEIVVEKPLSPSQHETQASLEKKETKSSRVQEMATTHHPKAYLYEFSQWRKNTKRPLIDTHPSGANMET
jgi:hypothetical protein